VTCASCHRPRRPPAPARRRARCRKPSRESSRRPRPYEVALTRRAHRPTAESTPARGGTHDGGHAQGLRDGRMRAVAPAPPKATRARPGRVGRRARPDTMRAACSIAASHDRDDTLGGNAGPVMARAAASRSEPGRGRGTWRRDRCDRGGDRRRSRWAAPPPRRSSAGPGIGTCALGPYDERSTRVDVGDRAASGARWLWMSSAGGGSEATRDPPRGGLGHSTEHEAHIGARAPHVEGDGIGEPRRRRGQPAGSGTGRGAESSSGGRGAPPLRGRNRDHRADVITSTVREPAGRPPARYGRQAGPGRRLTTVGSPCARTLELRRDLARQVTRPGRGRGPATATRRS